MPLPVAHLEIHVCCIGVQPASILSPSLSPPFPLLPLLSFSPPSLFLFLSPSSSLSPSLPSSLPRFLPPSLPSPSIQEEGAEHSSSESAESHSYASSHASGDEGGGVKKKGSKVNARELGDKEEVVAALKGDESAANFSSMVSLPCDASQNPHPLCSDEPDSHSSTAVGTTSDSHVKNHQVSDAAVVTLSARGLSQEPREGVSSSTASAARGLNPKRQAAKSIVINIQSAGRLQDGSGAASVEEDSTPDTQGSSPVRRDTRESGPVKRDTRESGLVKRDTRGSGLVRQESHSVEEGFSEPEEADESARAGDRVQGRRDYSHCSDGRAHGERGGEESSGREGTLSKRSSPLSSEDERTHAGKRARGRSHRSRTPKERHHYSRSRSPPSSRARHHRCSRYHTPSPRRRARSRSRSHDRYYSRYMYIVYWEVTRKIYSLAH